MKNTTKMKQTNKALKFVIKFNKILKDKKKEKKTSEDIGSSIGNKKNHPAVDWHPAWNVTEDINLQIVGRLDEICKVFQMITRIMFHV